MRYLCCFAWLSIYVVLQKEPKLARARQIPEWEQYDAEIAKFTRELAVQGRIHSRMATADANELAGGSAVSTNSAEDEMTGDEREHEMPNSKDADDLSRDEL